MTKRYSARERMAVVGEVLDFIRGTKKRNVTRPRRRISESAFVQGVAARRGIGDSTIWRWLRRYRAFGYEGLADARRRDAGTSFYFAGHPESTAILLQAINRRLNGKDSYAFLTEHVADPPCLATMLRERRRLIEARAKARRT